MKERIAVAVDFSSESERALKEAIEMARVIDAEIHLIHVSGRIDVDDESEGARSFEKELNEAVRANLAELHARYDGQGARLTQSIVEGVDAEAICMAASELGCQTIAVGTHGRSGLRRFLLGSVAEKVVRTANVDVLVARGTRPLRGYRRILVPTDFSAAAERALARAVSLASEDAEIDLLHVWQFPGPVTMHYSPISSHKEILRGMGARMRAEAEGRAAPLLKAHRRPGVGVDFEAVNGDPAQMIIDRAAGCDLIVMGTHGRRGFQRFALGSVAERTVRHASCSVLVAHANSQEEKK